MTFNVLLVVMGHKWMRAETPNEPGVRMVCRRCGRPQSHVSSPDQHSTNPADKRKDVGLGVDDAKWN